MDHKRTRSTSPRPQKLICNNSMLYKKIFSNLEFDQKNHFRSVKATPYKGNRKNQYYDAACLFYRPVDLPCAPFQASTEDDICLTYFDRLVMDALDTIYRTDPKHRFTLSLLLETMSGKTPIQLTSRNNVNGGEKKERLLESLYKLNSIYAVILINRSGELKAEDLVDPDLAGPLLDCFAPSRCPRDECGAKAPYQLPEGVSIRDLLTAPSGLRRECYADSAECALKNADITQKRDSVYYFTKKPILSQYLEALRDNKKAYTDDDDDKRGGEQLIHIPFIAFGYGHPEGAKASVNVMGGRQGTFEAMMLKHYLYMRIAVAYHNKKNKNLRRFSLNNGLLATIYPPSVYEKQSFTKRNKIRKKIKDILKYYQKNDLIDLDDSDDADNASDKVSFKLKEEEETFENGRPVLSAKYKEASECRWKWAERILNDNSGSKDGGESDVAERHDGTEPLTAVADIPDINDSRDEYEYDYAHGLNGRDESDDAYELSDNGDWDKDSNPTLRDILYYKLRETEGSDLNTLSDMLRVMASAENEVPEAIAELRGVISDALERESDNELSKLLRDNQDLGEWFKGDDDLNNAVAFLGILCESDDGIGKSDVSFLLDRIREYCGRKLADSSD